MTSASARQITGLLVAGLIWASSATAQLPEQIRYQGYLTDSAGQALDSAVNATLSLYTTESGGVPLWTDTRVLVLSQGLFSTDLGGPGNPFPSGLFDTALFLGIAIDTDLEMTPRVAFSSAPYAQRALDADTVGGLTAAALDQSADVAALQSEVGSAQTDIAQLQSDVAGAEADIGQALGELGQLQSDVSSAEGDIAQLQTDLATTDADLTTVENTLPTLQPLISQNCAAGSSIREISSAGGVTCELDDAGLWALSFSNAYFLSGLVGVGTSNPAAGVQIDMPAGTDPFRARVAGATKLRVHSNGSVSVGDEVSGPENGLYVFGDAGFGTVSPAARLSVRDPDWQMTIDNSGAGGNAWYVGSSADNWSSGGGRFVVSPTASSGNAALVVDADKDVGIGTLDPATRLHLGGGSDVTPAGGGYLTLGGTSGSNIAIDTNEVMARNNGSVATLALNAEGGVVSVNANGSRDADAMLIVGRVDFDNGGHSGMRITGTDSNPTNALFEPTLYEEGLVGSSTRPFWRTYSREFYAETPLQYRTYSDRTLKQNVRPVPNALATIVALEGVAYELRRHPMDTRDRALTEEQEFDRLHQLGFIAQDLEKVLPQMVSEDETTGLKTVGYLGVIPILVEAIKEQQAQIEMQRDLMASQAARLRALEERQ